MALRGLPTIPRRSAENKKGAVLEPAALAATRGTYQIVSEKAGLTRHPPPGRLFDVGGGPRLHLQCSRQGTGVFLAGIKVWMKRIPTIGTRLSTQPLLGRRSVFDGGL